MHELYIANKKYEILENKNGDCYIKDKNKNKYYYRERFFASNKMEFDIYDTVKWNYKDTILVLSLIFSIICLFFIFYNYKNIYGYIKYNSTMLFISFVYLIFNILLHELSHISILLIYGRRIGKIRFKWNLIFPAFAVDTSDSYILPRHRRFFVYIAGIETNLIVSVLTLLFLPDYAYLLKPVVWASLINLIPIGFIKTDGYHIIFNALLNMKDFKKNKSIWFVIGRLIFVFATLFFLFVSILQTFGIFS